MDWSDIMKEYKVVHFDTDDAYLDIDISDQMTDTTNHLAREGWTPIYFEVLNKNHAYIMYVKELKSL